MDREIKAPKEVRKRKFLLVLPVLALPFMTLMFWSLGGGSVENAEGQTLVDRGFNVNLPVADLANMKSMDKMHYYDKAEQDSVKFQELIKGDPNYAEMEKSDDLLSREADSFSFPTTQGGLKTSDNSWQSRNDAHTDEIYRKLAELNTEISKPVPTAIDDGQNNNSALVSNTSVSSSDVDRLEQMISTIDEPNGEDTEMKQLNNMLDKILDVQNPQRVQNRLNQIVKSDSEQVFPVSSQSGVDVVSSFDSNYSTNKAVNGFFSISQPNTVEGRQNTIKAVIQNTQTIIDGSTVKLRLLDDVFINGNYIPKRNFLYGVASLRGERLDIKINSIRYKNSIFPVELSVYDMDGLNGIYIPGAITRDVAKESADRSMQTLGLTSLDPNWEGQAAGAGLEAAKTLLSKKVKLVKVQVKAGYKVLLYDKKNDQLGK